MGDNVIQFPIGAVPMRQSQQAYEQLHEDRGRIAGQVLATSRKRLSWEDRTSIARRLHDEIARAGLKPGQIAAAAQLANGTKELNKLAMRADKDPKKAQLMAYPDRYYAVIKALARLTRKNVHLLVDRVTVGTAVHPTRAEQLSEVERTMRALELHADRVDRKLGLFDQYLKTFQTKRDFIRRGDLLNWPFYPLDEGDLPTPPTLDELNLSKKALKALGFGSADPSKVSLENVDRSLFDQSTHEYIDIRLAGYRDQVDWWSKVRDGNFAFWNTIQDDYAEGIEIEALACLPHVYLGMIVDWTWWGINDDESAIRHWRRELQKVGGQVPRLEQGDPAGEPRMLMPDSPDFHECEHAWLILYPDRQLTTLVPVLLQTDGYIGSHMERVTVSKLIELQRAGYITETPTSGYERLVEVIADKSPSGEYTLVESWLRTGRNLRLNPYLSVALKNDRARKNRDELFVGGAEDDNQ